MLNRRTLFTAVLVVLIAGISALGGVMMSPMITEITLPPGSAYENDISIKNTGDEAIVVGARAIGFIAPEGVPQFLDPAVDSYPYSGRDLLTLTPTEQIVQPGETVLFHYRVAMPEDLDPYGGRYAAAIFRVKPPNNGAQVVVAQQVASLFLLSPGMDAKSHLTFSQVSIYQKNDDPHKVVWTAKISNDGDIHISGEQGWGMIQITDEDGYIVGSVPILSHTMLPGNSYTHKEVWTAPDYLESGTYQFNLTVLIFGAVGTEPQRYFISIPIDLDL